LDIQKHPAPRKKGLGIPLSFLLEPKDSLINYISKAKIIEYQIKFLKNSIKYIGIIVDFLKKICFT